VEAPVLHRLDSQCHPSPITVTAVRAARVALALT